MDYETEGRAFSQGVGGVRETPENSMGGVEMKKKKVAKKECEHRDVTPYAVFMDDWLSEPWLYQVCDQCGKCFLVKGDTVEVC